MNPLLAWEQEYVARFLDDSEIRLDKDHRPSEWIFLGIDPTLKKENKKIVDWTKYAIDGKIMRMFSKSTKKYYDITRKPYAPQNQKVKD